MKKCQQDGAVYTSNPSQYKCVDCGQHWFCHHETPNCLIQDKEDQPMKQENWEETLNRFIENWCPMSAHLLDSDENDGERLRESFRDLLAKKDQEHRESLERIKGEILSEKVGTLEYNQGLQDAVSIVERHIEG